MNRRSMVVASAVMVASLGIITTSCGTTTSPSTPSQSLKPQKGGTLIFALPPQTNLNWFLPITTAAFDSVYNTQLINMLYKPLILINNNYQINWGSSIAKKITYNSQGTIYHVFLNKKWHWSNGQPVTAKDVLFTWNVIQAASAPTAPSPWPFVGAGTGDIPSGVKSVVENNPYELTFTLDNPANQQWFMYNGLVQLVPMPASVMDIHKNITNEIKYLGSEGTGVAIDTVVDGPFKVQKAAANQEWVLVPNPKYSGHKSLLNRLVFSYQGSNSAEFAALKTGTVDVGYLDLSEYGARNELTSSGDTIFPAYPLGMFYTDLNMYPGSPTRAIFNQLYVRQAMQMGIDENAINTDIYHNYAPATNGPIPNIPLTKFLDRSLGTPYPYNITKGERLLEAHGWKMTKGVMTKGGQALKFQMLYVTGSTASTEAVEVMQQDWGKEGIQVNLKGLPFGALIGLVSNAKSPTSWQIATGTGWLYDGPGWYPSGGELFATGAPSGYGYSNPTEDALIKDTHIPYPTQKDSMAAFFKYEDYTARQLPFLWNNNVATLVVKLPTVHDVKKYYNPSTGMPQFNYWWMSSK